MVSHRPNVPGLLRDARRTVTWSSEYRSRRRNPRARDIQSEPRSDGAKHRSHVGGPPDVLVWLGGALAPHVGYTVQPGQQNGNALVCALIDALMEANVCVRSVACGTQHITFL